MQVSWNEKDTKAGRRMRRMFCTNCGKEMEDNVEKCPYCNAEIGGDETTLQDVKDFAKDCSDGLLKKFKMATGIGAEGDKPMKFDRGQWNQEKAKINVEGIIPDRERGAGIMARKQPSTLRCPKCDSVNLQIITETSTKGKDFSAGKGCCGAIMLGPIGILCGACGKGKQIQTTSFWICNNCGNKFKV